MPRRQRQRVGAQFDSTAEWKKLLASWTAELIAPMDRIYNLIGNRHLHSKGQYRESLLRAFLRRLLPKRLRLSTGFIYRKQGPPSRQLDIIIWDAQQQSAHLEEAELAVLALQAVEVILEVKSTLTRKELRDALDLLSPSWLISWHPNPKSSRTGLPQHIPDGLPYRGVVAYAASGAQSRQVRFIFEELVRFYRTQFRTDAHRAMRHTGPGVRWSNVIDMICITSGLTVEQTHLNVTCNDGQRFSEPAFAAYGPDREAGNLSVGRLALHLQWATTGWHGGRLPLDTLYGQTPLAVCSFAKFPRRIVSASVFGSSIDPAIIWTPPRPLWQPVPLA